MEPGAAALLRSAIQDSQALAFVFAGSTVSLVSGWVGPAGPLHGIFNELTVGPIDPEHLATWIEDRLHSSHVEPEPGIGARIVERSGSRTEDVLRLARGVYDNAAHGGRAGSADMGPAVQQIVFDRRATCERIWVELAESQRKVLRALALDAVHLTSRDTITSFGLPTPAAVVKAVRRLRDRHLLSATGETIADPCSPSTFP